MKDKNVSNFCLEEKKVDARDERHFWCMLCAIVVAGAFGIGCIVAGLSFRAERLAAEQSDDLSIMMERRGGPRPVQPDDNVNDTYEGYPPTTTAKERPGDSGTKPSSSKEPDSPGEAESVAATQYTLSIRYLFPDGKAAFPTFSFQLEAGEVYSVVTPSIPGATPDISRIEGVMPAADVGYIVTYYGADMS